MALNQLALAPVTLAAVFTWNSVLTGQSATIPGKIQKDLVPNMINGEQTAAAVGVSSGRVLDAAAAAGAQLIPA